MDAMGKNSAAGSPSGRGWIRVSGFAIRIAAIAVFLVLTNSGFVQRVNLLLDQERLVTLAGYVGIWGLCFAALLIAAFQPAIWLRLGWAGVFAFATAVGFTFRNASGTEFSVLDAVSLWNARQEAARAAEFYSSEIYLFAAVLVFGLAVLAMPPAVEGMRQRRWLTRLAWVPLIPILAISAILHAREGGGAQALPTQFAPLSVAAVSGAVVLTKEIPPRRAVEWTWRGPFAMAAPRAESMPPRASPGEKAAVRHIVLLVDESIRPDYIDWTPGNPYTPNLAALSSRIVDFGPSASGGTCSHYANAILRFAASRNDLGGRILTNPTLWQYAKKAGFRTVYIDASAAFNKNPGKLQNFMTVAETADIDEFHALSAEIPAPELDYELLEIMIEALRSDEPVFIYANKNGAHFPYDSSYPESERKFGPTMSDVRIDSTETRVNSFRNAVRWSVDGFFQRLFEEGDLSETVIIYTSDHGQAFNPDRFSHCSVDDPDPREALVPLFVTSGKPDIHNMFSTAAEHNYGTATHFAITPTLLKLMGYRPEDIAGEFEPSLLEQGLEKPAFTSGDVFGLFSPRVRWHDIDLSKSYLEPVAGAEAALRPSDTANALQLSR